MNAMLQLLSSLLEMRHLLLHLLASLSLIMQLFFELLNVTERLLQSSCHVCNIWDVVKCASQRLILVNSLHDVA